MFLSLSFRFASIRIHAWNRWDCPLSSAFSSTMAVRILFRTYPIHTPYMDLLRQDVIVSYVLTYLCILGIPVVTVTVKEIRNRMYALENWKISKSAIFHRYFRNHSTVSLLTTQSTATYCLLKSTRVSTGGHVVCPSVGLGLPWPVSPPSQTRNCHHRL